MSGPRWMTLAISLGGLIVLAAMYSYLRADDAQSVSLGYLGLGLPFVLGLVVSVLPMRKRTRIMLYWLTAAIMSFAGVITIFSIGIYYVIAVFFFLAAAWMENESGEPSRRRINRVTTNSRTIPGR